MKAYERQGDEICFSRDNKLCFKLDPRNNFYNMYKPSEDEMGKRLYA